MPDRPDLNEDFRDMLEALHDEHVEMILVGAHAMAVHGVPRATGDIDIWVRPSRDNAERVLAALTRFGAPLAAHGITVEDFIAPGAVYQVGLPPRRIDLLTEVSGVSFDEAWASRVHAKIGELDDVPVLGLAELVRNKRASGRPRDLADLAILEPKLGAG
jgi:hypothetical protein